MNEEVIAQPRRLPRLGGRVLALLAMSIALHVWLLGVARRELDFELPPPQAAISVELFTLPAPVTVGNKPPPKRRAPSPKAVSAAPPATAAVRVEAEAEPEPEPAPPPEVPAPEPASAPAEPAPPPEPVPAPAPEPAPPKGEAALESVIVSFPKVGRFVSDTTAGKGVLHISGTTSIEWRIGDGRYSAKSETTDNTGRVYLSLSSEGRVEPSFGVAPERYVESRMERPPQAANFQWDAGKVTFSASAKEVPLRPGMQDQLSFLAQLALIAQAFPDRMQPGASIALELASTRDVRVYELRVVGWEIIRTEVGFIDTLKVERALPEGARDGRIELWLAPTMNWLPARTRTTMANDTWIETVLREAVIEP